MIPPASGAEMSLFMNSEGVRGLYRFSNGGLYPASGAMRSGCNVVVVVVVVVVVLVLSSVDANDDVDGWIRRSRRRETTIDDDDDSEEGGANACTTIALLHMESDARTKAAAWIFIIAILARVDLSQSTGGFNFHAFGRNTLINFSSYKMSFWNFIR